MPEVNTAGDALWNGQAHMPTARSKRLVIAGGEGAWLTTDTGERLLDATASLWYANVGHGRERIARAAYDQMCRLETFHTFGRMANEPALRVADRIVAMAGVPGAKVMLTSGGSDSVDLACKLARRHWQLEGRESKKMILSRHGAYHGLHAFGTSITGLPYNREGYGSESLVPETARIATNDLAAVPLWCENHVLLTPRDGPFEGRDCVTWHEAARIPLCLLTANMHNRQTIDSVFASLGEQPRPTLETDSIVSILAHVSAGHWSSIVPRAVLDLIGIPTGTRVFELRDPLVEWATGLLVLNRQPRSPMVEALMGEARALNLGMQDSTRVT